MTTSLQKAFVKASRLSEPLQNQLARQLVEDIEAEQKWDQTLAKSQDVLERMARKALRDRRQGKTHSKGFGQL